VNEGAWSVQVIEPVLAALDWPRLRRSGLDKTGAYFEWPGKHEVDVALLDFGNPCAFLELKDKHVGRSSCRNDLGNKLAWYPKLKGARFAVAAWFRNNPGFCIYDIRPDATLSSRAVVLLSDPRSTSFSFASFAKPVLLNGKSVDDWMQAAVTDASPIEARCHPRVVQGRFFDLLGTRLTLTAPMALRHRCRSSAPPTPTYAFTELPGVLPAGSGIVFDFDNTMNQLQVFFYRDGNRKTGWTPKWSFDETGINDTVLEAFIEKQVLPEIQRRRR
jgi:hypothetical protein